MKLSSTLQRFISVIYLAEMCGYIHAQRLTVLGWNIESGGATDAAIAQRVRLFQDVEIWELSEVPSDAHFSSARLWASAASDC